MGLLGDPCSYCRRLQNRGHCLAAGDGVQESDAGPKKHASAVARPRRAAHHERERHSLEVVAGARQPARAVARCLHLLAASGRRLGVASRLLVGLAHQLVGDVGGFLAADSHGDDPVVRQPAVANGVGVGAPVQLDAEHLWIVHLAHHEVGAARRPCQGGVAVDARRGGLIDAVRRQKGSAVMAQRELPQPVLGCGAALMAAHARCAVRLVADQHLEGVGGLSLLDALGDSLRRLVGAENQAHLGGGRPRAPLPDPGCNLVSVGGDGTPFDLLGRR